MGKVIVQDFTCKEPITMIGTEAGVCWGADISDQKKNYRRGIDCLESEHGRTFEFPDAYMILDGYSARVIREWYTHIAVHLQDCRQVRDISTTNMALIMSYRPALKRTKRRQPGTRKS